jgi:hypothetical protein
MWQTYATTQTVPSSSKFLLNVQSEIISYNLSKKWQASAKKVATFTQMAIIFANALQSS